MDRLNNYYNGKNNIEKMRSFIIDQFNGDERMADAFMQYHSNYRFKDLNNFLDYIEDFTTFHIRYVRAMETCIENHKRQGQALCFDINEDFCHYLVDSFLFMDQSQEDLNIDRFIPGRFLKWDYWWDTYFYPELKEMVKRQGVSIMSADRKDGRIYISG